MERPISKPIGTPAEELDTPSLLVDLDAMEHNIQTVHGFFRDREAKFRPHVHVHKSPAIAHQQLAVEGHAGGIAVSTLSEAETFSQAGFFDIQVANVVVTPDKIRRLCALARHARIWTTVDDPDNVSALSDAAQATGVTLEVLVSVNIDFDHVGVAPGRPAVALAQTVARVPGLRFAGLISFGGPISRGNKETLEAQDRVAVQRVLDTRQQIERAGLDVGTVSVGNSTHDYELMGSLPGVTEVRAGTAVLLDNRHIPYCPQLKPAARVLATVTSHPEPARVITDCGQKAIGRDLGLPAVDGLSGLTVAGLSAEHGIVDSITGQAIELVLGDRLWLIPADLAGCVNLHDMMFAVRDGELEKVWEVATRGAYA